MRAEPDNGDIDDRKLAFSYLGLLEDSGRIPILVGHRKVFSCVVEGLSQLNVEEGDWGGARLEFFNFAARTLPFISLYSLAYYIYKTHMKTYSYARLSCPEW